MKVTVATNKSKKTHFTEVFVRYYSASTKALGTPEDKTGTQGERERKSTTFYKIHKLTLSK